MLKRALSLFDACASPACTRLITGKLRFTGIRVNGEHYCSPDCLHEGLAREFHRLAQSRRRTAAKRQHRIPLGLLLMSRGEISEQTLKLALQEQARSAGTRIGQILLHMRAVTEDQITNAVASQWSVPVFRLDARTVPDAARLLPFAFMESYKMMPVHYVQQRNHLHLAFADVIDRTLIYAIERMLGVTTESSIAGESRLMHLLELAAQQPRPAEYVLNRVPEQELAGIVRGYAIRLKAEEIETAFCNNQIWVRTTNKTTTTHFLFGVAGSN